MKRKPIKPVYDVGDRVFHSCIKTGMNFYGTITQVIHPRDIHKLEINAAQQAWYKGRDPEYYKNYMYTVRPDSSPGPVSYQEAACLMHNLTGPLTPQVYDFFFKTRFYMCSESDLLPEADNPELPPQFIEVSITRANSLNGLMICLADMMRRLANGEVTMFLEIAKNISFEDVEAKTSIVLRRPVPLETNHETSNPNQ